MPDIYSFLQTVYQFVKSLAVNMTKKMYRTAAVFTTGAAVVTVVMFNSGDFSGAGKNAAVSLYGDSEESEDLTDELPSEETGNATGVRMEFQLAASNEQGQHLLGSLLEKNIQDDIAQNALEVEAIEKEVLMQAQQAKKEAEEREKQRKRENAVISYTDEDYEVLLRIVQAEVGICDDKGKILVANVIINRVKSSRFPGNVRDVVYQRSQFSPVSNGTINTCRVTQQTRDCVDRALAGEDYSDGALFFMNRSRSASSNVSWFDGHLTYITQHGGHEFYR